MSPWLLALMCLPVLSTGTPFAPQWMLHEAARPQSQSFKDVGEPLILTPLIEAGDLKKAREAARVDLKGLPGGLDIESYSGFLTVDKKYNSNLFFWYFPSIPGEINHPIESNRWNIWLQGGPGVSSMFGLFTELGPLRVTPNKTLEIGSYRYFSIDRCLPVLSTGTPFAPQWMLHEAARPQSQSFKDVGEPLILTPLIEAGDLKKAREAARVDLKGLPGGLDIESYSGFLTVDKKYNSNLFFWYFPSIPGEINHPIESNRWNIWLQGGPGVSSMFGLFTELGPLRVTPNKTLERMPFTWHEYSGLLFIDNPVGTGYSFADHGGYATNQTTIGEHLYIALQQFLTVFSELRTAPLSIFGESYGGKHVPSLAMEIHRNKEKDKDKPIRLRGISIGNAYIDPASLMVYSDNLRRIGLIGQEWADRLRTLEDQTVKAIQDGDLQMAQQVFTKLAQYTKYAIGLSVNIYNYLNDNDEMVSEPVAPDYVEFIQSEKARKALHVGNTTYNNFNLDVYTNITDFMASTKPWIEELVENYKVMLYNGQLDTLVPYYPGSVSMYQSLNFSGAEEYRKRIRSKVMDSSTEFSKVGGYLQEGGKFAEILIRKAGHMAPTDQPHFTRLLGLAFSEGLIPCDFGDSCSTTDARIDYRSIQMRMKENL